MERKRLFIIFGIIGAIILLALFTIGISQTADNGSQQEITNITLCDVDSRDLCIVGFGIDDTDQMVINIQLPNTDYPAFYIKGSNKGLENIYQCEIEKAAPTSVYCSGVRTPLGEGIDIKVYASNGDLLLAQETVNISAMMILTTPLALVSMPAGKIVTPTPILLTSPTAATQIESTPTVTSTPTPGVGYPNP